MHLRYHDIIHIEALAQQPSWPASSAQLRKAAVLARAL